MALASKLYEVSRDRELDLLHVHYAIPHATSALLAKQMLHRTTGKTVAVVTTLHGTDSYLVGLEPSYKAIVQYCLEESDAVTAVSEHLKHETIQNFELKRDVDVIYNFVTLVQDAKGKEVAEECASEEKRIVHVSNFRSLKRVTDALRVFELVSRACPCCRLVMVGEGPEMPAAQALTDDLGIHDRVTFAGGMTEAAAPIGSASLLLSTSEIESFGLTIAEAMAQGVPVVATRVGGVPEVLEDGKSGLLCAVGDICGMACAALRMLTDPSLAKEMGMAGRKRVAEHFSPEVIIPQYESLYGRVLDEVPQGHSRSI